MASEHNGQLESVLKFWKPNHLLHRILRSESQRREHKIQGSLLQHSQCFSVGDLTAILSDPIFVLIVEVFKRRLE